MAYKEYVPNPIIVDHAVDLWVDLLRQPTYDNGDKGYTGVMARILVEQIPRHNNDEILTQFGDELRSILLAPLEWDASPDRDGNPRTYTTLFRDLDVDYHPNIPLAEAAKRSGLKMEFPWKTTMNLYETYLTLAVGYGTPNSYHYPLSDGQWLIVQLSGNDMPKIIALVEQGIVTKNLEPSTEEL